MAGKHDAAAMADAMDRACRSIVDRIEWDDTFRSGGQHGKVRFNRAGYLRDVVSELAARSPAGCSIVVRDGYVPYCKKRPGRKVSGRIRCGPGGIAWKSKSMTDGILDGAAVLGAAAWVSVSEVAKPEYMGGYGIRYRISVVLPRSGSVNPLSLAARAATGPGMHARFRNRAPEQENAPPGFYSDDGGSGDDFDELPF